MTGRTKVKCRDWRDGSCIKNIFHCLRMSTWQQTNLSNVSSRWNPLPSTGLCGNCMYVMAKHLQVEIKALKNDPTCLGGHYFCFVVIIFHITHLSIKLEADWFAFPAFFRSPLLNVLTSWEAWNNVVARCRKTLYMLWICFTLIG